ncbi:flagellar assembly protein FliW [Halanaerocella petrolearia]
MKFETTRFGEIEFKEEEVIEFVVGPYGFEDEKQFTLIDNGEDAFFWLQSITNPDLAFVVTEPWSFYPDYEFEIGRELEGMLELEDKEDVLVINIVTVPENLQDITMNLKAPIIVNKKNQIAKQFILEDKDYPVKYPLIEGQENISA